MVKRALRMYEDSLCRCGHSMLLTQAADAQLAYRAKTVTCPACASGERERQRETGAGKITYVEDLRDTPGAMDPDADDVMWMPDDEDGVQMDMRYAGEDDTFGLDRYAASTPAAATASPAMSTTTATVPLPGRAS